jgi:outer membrane protein OmpA-like peptidoglycan-associated protein
VGQAFDSTRTASAPCGPTPQRSPSFTVGAFQVFGPDGSTLEGLVATIFKTAADKGLKTLSDILKTASEAIKVAKEGFSLGFEIVDKGNNPVEKMRPKPPGEDKRPPSIIFDQVAFDHDKNTLTDAARKSLDQVVAYLLEGSGKSDRILIEGHASAVGSPNHNLTLSRERASGVRDYLLDRGLKPERMLVYGFGQGYLWLPFFPDHPDNRRVRITTCGEGWGSNRCLAER